MLSEDNLTPYIEDVYTSAALVAPDATGTTRPIIRIIFTISSPFSPVSVTLGLRLAHELHLVAKKAVDPAIPEIDSDTVLQVAMLGSHINTALLGDRPIPKTQEPYTVQMLEIDIINQTFDYLKNRPLGPTYKDAVLWFSWLSLTGRHATSKEAATLASRELETTYNAEAFRQLVNRWAGRNGLDKVEKYKRK